MSIFVHFKDWKLPMYFLARTMNPKSPLLSKPDTFITLHIKWIPKNHVWKEMQLICSLVTTHCFQCLYGNHQNNDFWVHFWICFHFLLHPTLLSITSLSFNCRSYPLDLTSFNLSAQIIYSAWTIRVDWFPGVVCCLNRTVIVPFRCCNTRILFCSVSLHAFRVTPSMQYAYLEQR